MRRLLLLLIPAAVLAAASDSPPPYADEAGYQARIHGMIERIAAQEFLHTSMGKSLCPDTGLPVYSWALAGESILSPFTGRSYIQPDTGYFGPKRRGADGRIVAFGGDPLKHALPPAAATLLLDPTNARARAFLSIPGTLSQQYHFACVNWVRFLGVAGHVMPAEWHKALQAVVAEYAEAPREARADFPEYQPRPGTENLVGLEQEHLGGGGTENHKTMWRTSGLVYAQTFPADVLISGSSATRAEAVTTDLLTDYVRKLYRLGSGEWDSSTYYPYSFRGFVNVFDFSPKPETRAMARAALDYYLATYGLKVFNGVHTGPQRRGWSAGHELGEMDRHLWAWAGSGAYTTVPVDQARVITTLHQVTSGYRPDRLITELIAKQVPLPFEARLNHPDYGMTQPGRQAEYFYCAKGFAMGSVQLDAVNNSAQQTTWSLNVRAPRGSFIFGGGQPRWLHPEGHSPYDQWVQKRGALLLMSSATAVAPGLPPPLAYTGPGQLAGPRSYSRSDAFSGPRAPAEPPAATDAKTLSRYFEGARSQASVWLFVPRECHVREDGARFIMDEGPTRVVVTPFHARTFWLDCDPPERPLLTGAATILRDYRVLVIPGETTGFAIEAVEADAVSRLSRSSLEISEMTARYRSLAGDELVLQYQPAALRPIATINGERQDFDRWAGGAVCESPYLNIKDGRMRVSNGAEAYELDYTGPTPRWSAVPRP